MISIRIKIFLIKLAQSLKPLPSDVSSHHFLELSPPAVPVVHLTGPNTFLSGSHAPVFNSEAQGTEEHSAELTWTVRTEDGALVEHREHSVSMVNRDIASKVELPNNMDTNSVTVTCSVENEAGVGEDKMLVKRIGNTGCE